MRSQASVRTIIVKIHETCIQDLVTRNNILTYNHLGVNNYRQFETNIQQIIL